MKDYYSHFIKDGYVDLIVNPSYMEGEKACHNNIFSFFTRLYTNKKTKMHIVTKEIVKFLLIIITSFLSG